MKCKQIKKRNHTITQLLCLLYRTPSICFEGEKTAWVVPGDVVAYRLKRLIRWIPPKTKRGD